MLDCLKFLKFGCNIAEMKRFLLILAIFGTINAFAQKKGYSIQAGVNYSMIGNVSETHLSRDVPTLVSGYVQSLTMNQHTNKEVYKGNTGFFVSIKKDRAIYKRVFLTTGLSLEFRRFNRFLISENKSAPISFANGGNFLYVAVTPKPGIIYGNGLMINQNGYVVIDPNAQPITYQSKSSKRTGDTEMLSLEMPILVGTRFFKEKLVVQGGLNIGYLLTASQYKRRYASSPPTYYTRREENSDDFNKFSYGLTFSTSYRFTKKFGVQFSALGNLTPLYSDKGKLAGDTYLNSFSAGVSYFIK